MAPSFAWASRVRRRWLGSGPHVASIRRQRDNILRSEPQHERTYLFRIPVSIG